jgi:hypothetical protein
MKAVTFVALVHVTEFSRAANASRIDYSIDRMLARTPAECAISCLAHFSGQFNVFSFFNYTCGVYWSTAGDSQESRQVDDERTIYQRKVSHSAKFIRK